MVDIEKANVEASGQWIISGAGLFVQPPTGDYQAATKGYVDGAVSDDPQWVSGSGYIQPVEDLFISGMGLVTSGSISGVNVTSGTDPGHVHTTIALTTIPMYNNSGGTLEQGAPVYVTGWNVASGKVEVSGASADIPTSMPGVGLMEAQVTDGNEGQIVNTGALTSIKTDQWAIGDELYISGAVGQLTNVKPKELASKIQKIAQVERSHVSLGSLLVFGAGRSNDVPNQISVAGSISGVNVTSGADPGHTHTGYADQTQFNTVSGQVVANTDNIVSLSGLVIKDGTDIVSLSGLVVQNTSDILSLSGLVVTNTATIETISGNLLLLSGVQATHAADTTDPHGALLSQTNLSGSSLLNSQISGSHIIVTGDVTLSGSDYVSNSVFGTSATPPTASGYTQGTIYYQYTP